MASEKQSVQAAMTTIVKQYISKIQFIHIRLQRCAKIQVFFNFTELPKRALVLYMH